jgi:hypothetical protein
VDPPEPELKLEREQETPRSSTGALIRVDNNALVAPAALLQVVQAILPLYAVILRLVQFALWRPKA